MNVGAQLEIIIEHIPVERVRQVALARVGGHQGAGFVTERWVGGENDSLQSSVATTIIEVDDGDGIGVLWKHSRGGQ